MKREWHQGGRRTSSQTAGPILEGVKLFVCLLLIVGPVSAQEWSEYPDPFPGGYPSMDGSSGGGKMYMESYFPPPVTASPTYPSWSADGESLAFAYQGRIWVVSVEGGIARQLTTGPGYHSQPSWSPDGRYVAYAADVDRNFDIYILDREAGESRRITNHPHLDLRPRWSPDGSRILFTTSRDGTFDLWAYDVERGVAEPVVADSNQHDMAGDWIGGGRRPGLRLEARRGRAGLRLPLAVECIEPAGGTASPRGDQLPGRAGRRPPRRIGRIHHRCVGEQRSVSGAEREGGERDPAGAPDSYENRRVLSRLVTGRRAAGIRAQRRDAGSGENGRSGDGLSPLHCLEGRGRAPAGPHRRLRVVGAVRKGPGPRERFERGATPVPHLSPGGRRTQLLSGR